MQPFVFRLLCTLLVLGLVAGALHHNSLLHKHRPHKGLADERLALQHSERARRRGGRLRPAQAPGGARERALPGALLPAPLHPAAPVRAPRGLLRDGAPPLRRPPQGEGGAALLQRPPPRARGPRPEEDREAHLHQSHPVRLRARAPSNQERLVNSLHLPLSRIHWIRDDPPDSGTRL
ncbi:hypothetical protein CEXT_663631 [Caerostris extrusa]|uniref:Uncharacterized protein n=1 Tax=Caerostris extrusa TaxID=172846 RepID=A0AAV4X0C0_CAEEX|nr:hypothetical protein CEXT_663631 [Caerostris extrusa]